MPNKLSKRSNSSSQIAGAEAFIAGFKKHLMTVPSLNVAGKSVTPNDVINLLQARVDAVVAVQTTHAAFRAAVSNLKSAKDDTNEFVISLHTMVKAMFSTQPDVLADFGLSPRKKATAPTADQRAQAVAKSLATRKARGTVGPKKKLQIHGVLPSETPTHISETTTTVKPPNG